MCVWVAFALRRLYLSSGKKHNKESKTKWEEFLLLFCTLNDNNNNNSAPVHLHLYLSLENNRSFSPGSTDAIDYDGPFKPFKNAQGKIASSDHNILSVVVFVQKQNNKTNTSIIYKNKKNVNIFALCLWWKKYDCFLRLKPKQTNKPRFNETKA